MAYPMMALISMPVFRYIIAGGTAAAVNWLVRFPLSRLLSFSLSILAATLIGMVVGFVLYRGWVFPPTARPLRLQIRDFVAVNAVGALVTVTMAVVIRNAILPALNIGFYNDALSHALGIAAGAFANYFGHRQFTFQAAS